MPNEKYIQFKICHLDFEIWIFSKKGVDKRKITVNIFSGVTQTPKLLAPGFLFGAKRQIKTRSSWSQFDRGQKLRAI